MARISQEPARLDLRGIVGSPFILTVTTATTDMSAVSVVCYDSAGAAIAAFAPTASIASPTTITITWTAAQTTAQAAGSVRYQLVATISGLAALPLLGGTFTLSPPGTANSSTSSTAALTVYVGSTLATLDVTVGAVGATATDAIWDAKGDLAVGTGANTAQKLTVGADNYVLTADSAQTTGLKWAAASAGASALDDLTDVTITAAASGDLLRYSGSAWVDYPDSNYATAGHNHTGTYQPLVNVPVVVSGTTDTLAAVDSGAVNIYTNAALVTVTLPTDAGDDLADGFTCTLYAAGAAGLTLSTSGITLIGSAPTTTVAQDGVIVVVKTSTANTWMVVSGAEPNLNPTPVVVSGTTDTLSATDNRKTNRYTNASLVTVTLPTDAGEDLIDGFWCAMVSEGAAGLTVTTTSLTVPTGTLKTITQGQTIIAMKTGSADTWVLIGGTAA